MHLVKPLSAIDLEINRDNFPALRHAFTAEGLDGTALHDLVGDIVITNASGWELKAGGKFGAVSGIQAATGTGMAPGTNDFAMIVVGDLSMGNEIAFGEYSVDGPSITYRPGIQIDSLVRTDSDYGGLAVLSNTANILAGATVIKPSANAASKYGVKATSQLAVVGPTAAGAGTYNGAWGALDISADGGVSWVSSTAAGASGAFLFVFERGAPSDRLMFEALHWMAVHPGKIYPGLRGLA